MTDDEKKVQKRDEYDASKITVLEGLAPVRKRPGMYIGGTGIDGLHHLVWEVVDNSIDEAMAGFCDKIVVILHKDGSVSVEDNGRGIPVDKVKATGKSALETVLTVLHAGGKFGDGGYKVSGGLHGVGVSVVNALSVSVKATVKKNGKRYYQEYDRGVAKEEIKMIGDADGTGTTITFMPDPEIFDKTTTFSFKTILNHCRQQAYLTKGVMVTVRDEREIGEFIDEEAVAAKEANDSEPSLINEIDGVEVDDKNMRTGRGSLGEEEAEKEKIGRQEYSFYFEGGIASYVRHINKNREALNDPPMYVEKESANVVVELALAYTDDFKEHLYTFANNINTAEGGTHLTGFRTALTRAINDYAKKHNLLIKGVALTGEDVREGLTAVLSVKLPDPQFEGQTKAKLGNTEVRTIVDSVAATAIIIYLEEHPTEAKRIIEKCSLSARARMAARAARDTIIRKGALEGMTLPGKLADCSSKDSSRTEVYIVEGDSAGGCFSGETKISLADGREISFKDIVKEWQAGKQNFCYKINSEGEITIGKILNPRITKKNAQVIKIILDNGEEIVCTPEHLFMQRDGSYLEAKSLKSDMSLMPLRKKVSKIEGRITIEGYEMVLNPSNHKWIFTHKLADEFNIDHKKYDNILSHKHHVDFNKRNNNPTNIKRISPTEHLEIHRKQISKTLHRPDAIEKCNAIKRTPEYRAKISEKMKAMKDVLSKRAKKQWQDPKYVEFMMEKFLEFYKSNPEYREKNRLTLNLSQKKYWAEPENIIKQSDKTRKFYLNNPNAKLVLRQKAKKQWQDPGLLNWRSEEAKKQWTDAFREKRKIAYDKTYLFASLSFAKNILEKYGNLEKHYELTRKSLIRRNNNVLSFATLIKRFFENDKKQLDETVKNFNHKIKSIEVLKKKIDVYDIEVPNTHNFALSSGVFVHNSAKQGRDRQFQAILPLRGKILNVERARLDRMLTSDEIKALIVAMGVGVGEEINYAKLRYDRIIIMTDADVDGAHIRTLLLTFFFRNFPELIENGHIYIAQPPLYSVSKGKEKHWVYSDIEKDNIVKKLKGDKEAASGIMIQRFKGLGEMNPQQLWDTTMNPESRILLQVATGEAEQADQTFTMLMGDQVAPRKKFIQTRAKSVKNLDT